MPIHFRHYLGAIILMIAAGSASLIKAQPALPQDWKCGGETAPHKADQLLARTFNWPVGRERKANPIYVLVTSAKNPVATGSAELDAHQGAAGSEISLTLTRPDDLDSAVWGTSYTFGAAQTERKRDNRPDGPPLKQVGVGTFIKERSPQHMIVTVTLPETPNSLSYERWTIVPVLC